jgi:SAM-dependent methyltransferase
MITIDGAKTDLAAIKAGQQRAWGSGNYAAVAARIQPMAELLVDAADLEAGSKVLDVATGSGNAALAAARLDTRVTGIDYVPELLELGRGRAAAEGLDIDFAVGDAEELAFEDGSFDAVISSVGVMFATDQDRAAAELLRVCRPGGSIALANWTPASFVGEMFRTIGRYLPPPAAASPLGWGTEQRLEELLGAGVSELLVRPRTFIFRFASAQGFADFFRVNYGPVHTAFAKLDDAGQGALERDLVELAAGHNRSTSSAVAIPAEYLEVVATRGLD